MTYIAIYHPDGRSVVREKSTMSEPQRPHPAPPSFDMDVYIRKRKEYEAHLASLKQYPASWVTEEMDGKDKVEGVDFRFVRVRKQSGMKTISSPRKYGSAYVAEEEYETVAEPITPPPTDEEENQSQMWCDIINSCRFYTGDPHDLAKYIDHFQQQFTLTRKQQ